jgi:hypothetical protein
MNNTLYTFGCSFTEDFKSFFESEFDTLRKRYMVNHLNGAVPKSWPEVLSEKLNMNLVNRAAVHGHQYENHREGNCNSSIFNNICHMCDEFKKGDVVIVEWSFMVRFKWATDWGMITILPNQSPKSLINENVAEEIIVNRYNKVWVDELFVMMKMLNKLSESIGFDIYYWTVDNEILNHKMKTIVNDQRWLLSDQIMNKYYFSLINDNGGFSISDETNGTIDDTHLGVTGHNVLSNLFYDYIINHQRQTRFEDLA